MNEQRLDGVSPVLYRLDSYDYELPESYIAQTPASPRDSSRLLAWNVKGAAVTHAVFRDIVDLLDPSDLLILNDTKVLPARLRGHKMRGEGKAEILLLSPAAADFSLWHALVRPGRRLPASTELLVGDRTITVRDVLDDGVRLVEIGSNKNDVLSFLEKYGEVPLPPYIKTMTAASRASYQTVFALNEGSVAAPTASLHFTQELLQKIREKGVQLAWVTLHVGLGTFRPVKTDDIRAHHIHSEYCSVPEATAAAIRQCRERNGRVIAAGTTVARTLESMSDGNGLVRAGALNTELFIYPGFHYNVVNSLLTNFHLPKSSLLMLVAAFVANLKGRPGCEREALADLKKVYQLAITEHYRFFSFGDAMLIANHEDHFRQAVDLRSVSL